MRTGLVTLALVTASALAFAQTPQPPASPTAAPAAQAAAPRPASPPGTAQTQVAGAYVKDEKGRERYQGGKWIEITYGRPIKRGRDLFGSGADYGKTLSAGAPVWRAGANQSTRLVTEVPLVIGGKTIPAGEYTMFVELKSPTEWTLIVSSYGAKKSGNDPTPDALWGSYDYTPDKDVVRTPMTISENQASIDQLTWGFADVTKDGGKIFVAWDMVNAAVPFTVGK